MLSRACQDLPELTVRARGASHWSPVLDVRDEMAKAEDHAVSYRFTLAARRFIDCPKAPAMLGSGDIVILGAGHGTPYPATKDIGYDVATGSSDAPQAIQDAATQNSSPLTNYDFDLGGPLLDRDQPGLFDAGDLLPDTGDDLPLRRSGPHPQPHRTPPCRTAAVELKTAARWRRKQDRRLTAPGHADIVTDVGNDVSEHNRHSITACKAVPIGRLL